MSSQEQRAAVRRHSEEIRADSLRLRLEARRLLDNHSGRAESDRLALSPRERHVAAALKGGATSKQIGYELGIAKSTVNYHLANLYRKLGVHNRMAAVRRLSRLERQAGDARLTADTP